MTNKMASRLGLIGGLLGAAIGIGAGVLPQFFAGRVAPPKAPLAVRLDPAGPYVILATRRAATDYARAIEAARPLHPQAERLDFDPGLDEVGTSLRRIRPRYAMVFIEPDELDVNFAWRWLETTSRLDDDPFVDVRTGFITGASPEAAAALIARTADAVGGRLKLPGALVDDLGPPEVGDQKYFNTLAGADMAPALGARLSPRSVFHGKGCFTDDKLDSLKDAGIIHFGGHGHPDRIDDGLTAAQVAGLNLAPCVVFNGACYTGVTGRWFDTIGPEVVEKGVAPRASFCLKMLGKDVLAYLAAVHPDHGMPVYQEMEHLAYRGGPLGDAIKGTYDGVVLGAGGKRPEFERLEGGMKSPRWTPAEIMLKGTAARLLFGDPALVLGDAFAPAPFKTAVEEKGDALRVTATVANPGLKSTFTDTYHNDLNTQAPFNDRALLVIDLPSDGPAVGRVEVAGVRVGGKALPHRLVGYAVENDQGARRLHVQVDVPATGFQTSAFRIVGATVEIVARRPGREGS